jgi:ankyrin repeat protein
LFAACRAGYLDVVQCLVEELGADVNQATNAGYTPVHTAAILGRTEVVRCLVKSGANLNKALLFAVIEGSLDRLCLNRVETPLSRATANAKADVVRCLVKLGADIDHEDEHGERVLILALSGDDLDMMRCMVDLGANVGERDRFGASPLSNAASCGRARCFGWMQCLVELGASAGIKDDFGYTALLMCAICGLHAAAHLLREKGEANIDDVDRSGNTVWDVMTERLNIVADEADPLALTTLLRCCAKTLPSTLVALLSPEDAEVIEVGTRLPAYLIQRRTILKSICPLLPSLCKIVHGYIELTTAEEIWAALLGYDA